MNYRDLTLNVMQDVANNPKTLAASAGTTSALSFAQISNLFNGWLSTAGIVMGLIATGLLIRLHWISYKNAVIQNRILLQQAAELDNKGA